MPLSAAFHVCEDVVKDKIKSLEDQNAELLAALSEIEAQCANVSNGAFDSRGAVKAIAAIVKVAKAKGEQPQ